MNDIEQLIIKVNDNIILLRQTQNELLKAITDINMHNQDKEAHKEIWKELEVGKEWDEINELKVRVKDLKQRLIVIQHQINESNKETDDEEVDNTTSE